MDLSTLELHHYTSSRENLVNILTNGFIPSFCCESYFDDNQYWLPMVSFCDIPIHLSEVHKYWYGDYVIAMKHDWSSSKDIQPVHYMKKPNGNAHNLMAANNFIKSQCVKSFEHLTESLAEEFNQQYQATKGSSLFSTFCFMEHIKKINDLFYPISIKTAYEKPFEGVQYCKKTGTEEPKKFYDEREWRYIPSLTDFNDFFLNNYFNFFFELIIRKEYYTYHLRQNAIENFINKEAISEIETESGKKKSIRDQISIMLNGERLNYVSKYALKFTPDDVEYIIVPNESDISSIKDNSDLFKSLNFITWEKAHKKSVLQAKLQSKIHRYKK